MQIKALVKVINPVVSGVSQSTGNPYQTQDIILEWQEFNSEGKAYNQHLKVKLYGENVTRFAQLQPIAGTTIADFDISFNTSTFNGKVYNDVSARI